MDIFNLFEEQQEWDGEQDRDGYRHRVARIGGRLGAEGVGASLYELPPGESTWPYHYEHASEEWVLVVVGRPTLRTPDGERELAPGDVAVFPRGPAGAHAVENRGGETARVVILSTKHPVEVVEYPVSGKVGVWDQGYVHILRGDATVDYWEGER